ncbi:MAG: hypothetical protein Q9159_006603 [Coniocarpon cinnabarinum]
MGTKLAPIVALAHGGGPMPLLGGPRDAELASSLKNRVPRILGLDASVRPRAIIVCTAHWSQERPTISSAQTHQLLYDYYGFPAEAYQYKYDASGSPQVAQELADALDEEGLSADMDSKRGWDHGVFVPLMLIRPQADIPIVQLSVLSSEDPGQHWAMGRALLKMRQSNVAVIASGLASLHNLRAFKSGENATPEFKRNNIEWSKAATTAASESDRNKRQKLFEDWRQWPHSYQMHPRGGGEHFLPLIVAAGAAGESKAGHYIDKYGETDLYTYYWE